MGLEEMDYVEEAIKKIIKGKKCEKSFDASWNVTYKIEQATAPYLSNDDYMGKETVWFAQGDDILVPFKKYCCSKKRKKCEKRIIKSLGLPIDEDKYRYGFYVGYAKHSLP